MKKLISLFLPAALFLTGCASNYPTVEQAGPTSRVTAHLRNDGELRFGVVADIHNETCNAGKTAEEFWHRNIHGIIIAGDISRYFLDANKIPEEKEIRDSLLPFLVMGRPVYVIAGNHESRKTYSSTIASLSKEYPYLYDLTHVSYVDLNGVNLFGVSGGIMTAPGGFSIKKETENVDKNVFSLDDDPVLMVSHVPPKFHHKGAIDCTYDVFDGKKIVRNRHEGEKILYEGRGERKNPKNQGYEELAALIEKGVNFSVSGHYHMNQGANDSQSNLPQNTYSQKLFMNPGACQYRSAAILTIKDHQAKYELLKVD